MQLIRRTMMLITAALAASAVVPAWAQGAKFPETDKTLKFIVPFAPGGGVDSAARLLANQLNKKLGMPVIVENRAGASGTVGGKAVQTAAADGYTLLFSASTHVLAKQVLSSPPYDPQTDFAAVARVGEAPLLLVIAPNLPHTRLSDVISAARQQGDKWATAIPAAGAASHLGTLLLAKRADIKPLYVNYKGTAPAATDVAGGHTQMLFDSMISLMPLAKSGKLKPIAISSPKRSPLMPDVPTVHESGIANYAYETWYGVWAPKGLPSDRLQTLNGLINEAVAELGKSGAFANLGIEAVTETPEQFRKFVAEDVAQSAELLRAAGFKPE